MPKNQKKSEARSLFAVERDPGEPVRPRSGRTLTSGEQRVPLPPLPRRPLDLLARVQSRDPLPGLPQLGLEVGRCHLAFLRGTVRSVRHLPLELEPSSPRRRTAAVGALDLLHRRVHPGDEVGRREEHFFRVAVVVGGGGVGDGPAAGAPVDRHRIVARRRRIERVGETGERETKRDWEWKKYSKISIHCRISFGEKGRAPCRFDAEEGDSASLTAGSPARRGSFASYSRRGRGPRPRTRRRALGRTGAGAARWTGRTMRVRVRVRVRRGGAEGEDRGRGRGRRGREGRRRRADGVAFVNSRVQMFGV